MFNSVYKFPVVENAKSDIGIENPVKAAVNQIISELYATENFQTSQTPNTNSSTKKLRNFFLKPKALLVVVICIIIVIILSFIVPIIMKKEIKTEETTRIPVTTDQPITLSTESPSSPPTESSTILPTDPNTEAITTPSTTSTPTTTITTTPKTSTTEVPVEIIKVIKRETWLTKGLNISGKYKQLTPIRKVLLTTSKTDSCFDYESCVDFIAEQQMNSYPTYDDVKENFLIDSFGAIYEGRGFERESQQTTYETFTTYVNKAILINFILDEKSNTSNTKQQKALCGFLHESIRRGYLSENYVLFELSALLASFYDVIDETAMNACELNWRKRKTNFSIAIQKLR